MKKIFLILAILLAFNNHTIAQRDSVDVIDYTLTLDVDHQLSRNVVGCAEITLDLLAPCSTLDLDFQSGNIDSVIVNGVPSTFTFANSHISIPAQGLAGRQLIRIRYNTNGFVESYGFGGFHLGATIHYNLGIAFQMWPPSMGRTVFPCRDNFYDKATYHLTITSPLGWRSICSGTRMSEVVNEDGSTTSVWWLEKNTPTYLFSLALAEFHVIERTIPSLYGNYPVTLGFTSHDSLSVVRAFNVLDTVVPMYERCFGPYRWDRIGYVSTPKGSMEHVNNIALVTHCMSSMDEMCQSTICHELGHSWFGNLITCSDPQDMWFNEGGASFTSEVAFEAAYGRRHSDNYYNSQLESVLRTSHVLDEGIFPLHGIPSGVTYGSTTYDKGHTMWHSLRGYLGEEVFYNTLQMLFERNAFGSMDVYGVRDSLSQYSGTDLTDFFDFHVMNPGFVDYVVDSLRCVGTRATIALHQQLRHATQYCRSNRIPVTFFDAQRNQHKVMLAFDGPNTIQSFDLPFEAAYAVVDYDREFSDAVTDGEASFSSDTTLEEAHLFLRPKNGSAYAHIAHHWTAPQGEMDVPVSALAGRFWTISCSGEIMARFKFSRGNASGVSSPYLDLDFLTDMAQADSLCLLYRKDAGEKWRIISRQRRGSKDDGSIELNGLMSGDYALALCDPSQQGIEEVATNANPFLSPNPSKGLFKADLSEGRYGLRVYALSGSLVAEISHMEREVNLSHLQAGTYVSDLVDAAGRIVKSQKIIIL